MSIHILKSYYSFSKMNTTFYILQFLQSDNKSIIVIPSSVGTKIANNSGKYRSYIWALDSNPSPPNPKNLCLFVNNTDKTYDHTNITDVSFDMIGFFKPSYYDNDHVLSAREYSFTGEHSSMVCDEEYNKIMNSDDMIGMIVCSSGKIYNLPYNNNGDTYKNQIDNIKPVDSQPMSCLSQKYKDKKVLGVISSIEKTDNRENNGKAYWTGILSIDNDGRKRIRIASVGEGGMWITNEYGNLENGDYICSSNISGYGCKQDDDGKYSYTVGKILMDCDFNINQKTEYKTQILGFYNNKYIIASYVAVTFHCG